MDIEEKDGQYPVVRKLKLGDVMAEVSIDEGGCMYADPRQDDNLGVMACDHPRYSLGDEDGDAILAELREECESWDEAYAYLQAEYGATVVMPLYLYDHSGISMSTGKPFAAPDKARHNAHDPGGWDTSIVGVVFDTTERRQVMGSPAEGSSIESILDAEVREYSRYLEGEVYCVNVYDRHGELTEESIGWILGFEYAMDEARMMLEAEYRHARGQDARVLEWAKSMGSTLAGAYVPIGMPEGPQYE